MQKVGIDPDEGLAVGKEVIEFLRAKYEARPELALVGVLSAAALFMQMQRNRGGDDVTIFEHAFEVMSFVYDNAITTKAN